MQRRELVLGHRGGRGSGRRGQEHQRGLVGLAVEEQQAVGLFPGGRGQRGDVDDGVVGEGRGGHTERRRGGGEGRL